MSLAFLGGVAAVLAITVLGIGSLVFGIIGWRQAAATGSSPALGIAGTFASVVGFLVWLIAAIDLMFILLGFLR